jgi:CheY-like chemotaxis protein
VSTFPSHKPRILIVEDEYIIADVIREIVEECGCEAIGPYGTLSEALRACTSQDADAAIVDLILHGESAYPIADVLAKRRIPFGFATGRDTAATERAWNQRPCLDKPFSENEMRQFLGELLARP